jgi:hypothetical protein
MQQKQSLLQKRDLDPLNHRKSPARHMIAMKSLHMEKEKSSRIYEESIPDQPSSSSSSSLTSAPLSSAACLPKHLYILQQCISSQQKTIPAHSKQETKQKQQYEQRRITIQIQQRQRE